MSIIPALGKWTLQNWEFKASLGHIATWGLRLTWLHETQPEKKKKGDSEGRREREKREYHKQV